MERAAELFAQLFGSELLGSDKKLLFPIVKLHGKRFARTAEQGVYVVRSAHALYSLYESRERTERVEHERAWAEFAEGVWTDTVPRDAGLYFALSKDGYQSVRQLVKCGDGSVRDVSGGYLSPGQRTSWLGTWWSKRIPNLRGAK